MEQWEVTIRRYCAAMLLLAGNAAYGGGVLELECQYEADGDVSYHTYRKDGQDVWEDGERFCDKPFWSPEVKKIDCKVSVNATYISMSFVAKKPNRDGAEHKKLIDRKSRAFIYLINSSTRQARYEGTCAKVENGAAEGTKF